MSQGLFPATGKTFLVCNQAHAALQTSSLTQFRCRWSLTRAPRMFRTSMLSCRSLNTYTQLAWRFEAFESAVPVAARELALRVSFCASGRSEVSCHASL